MRTRHYEDIMSTRHYEDIMRTFWGHFEDIMRPFWGPQISGTKHRGHKILCRKRREQNVDEPMEPVGSVDLPTWWRSLGWAVPCPPVHTSSSLWTGGTGRACKGQRTRSRGWRWPRAGSGGLLLGRSVSPGHKREPSLKPWETHSIRRHEWGKHLTHREHGHRGLV